MKEQRTSVCCLMPCRTNPDPVAFRAFIQEAMNSRSHMAFPAREPRDKNRNNCVASFLASEKDYTHLLFVDDDTEIPQGTVAQLLAHDKDIVCGVQPLCLRPPNKPEALMLVANVMPFPTLENARPAWPEWVTWQRPEKLYQIRYCGFGCVLIRRKVFEEVAAPWFVEDHGDQFGRNNTSEDVYFCNKAHRAGFDIFCDPNLVTKHWKTVCLNDFVPAHMVEDDGEIEQDTYVLERQDVDGELVAAPS